MTREEIAGRLGCEVPASIVMLARNWEGRQNLLNDLEQALPVYKEVRRSAERKLGPVPDVVWDLADELGHVHPVVYGRENGDDEADFDLDELVEKLRVIRQWLGTVCRRRTATETEGDDEAGYGADLLHFGLDEKHVLSANERACAQTITDYWAAVMGAATTISAFRQHAFGDPRRTLGSIEGDKFIASPLVRLCSFYELARAGVKADAQGARVGRWDVDCEQCDHMLTDYEHEDARFAPDLNLLTHEAMVYRFTVEIPASRAAIQGTVMCRPSSQLSWIPYMPMDPEPYDGDETFPAILPRSVAALLAKIAAYWAARLPWEEWEIARFIVTGDLPTLRPIQVTIHNTAHGAAYAQRVWSGPGKWREAECTATFARRMRTTSEDPRLRGAVTIVVEPWVSEATVRRCYSSARDIAMGRTDRSRGATHGCRNQRVRIPTKEALGMVRAATANALQPRAEDRRSLRSVLRRGSHDYANDLKAYKRALETLDLDPDPLTLFRHPDYTEP